MDYDFPSMEGSFFFFILILIYIVKNSLILGDTGSIEYGAECEEHPRRDSQSIDNGNNK